MSGPEVWSVIDSDNYECGGIVSLHWSKEGALTEAHRLVSLEDDLLKKQRQKPMKLSGIAEWTSRHRTISVQIAEIQP